MRRWEVPEDAILMFEGGRSETKKVTVVGLGVEALMDVVGLRSTPEVCRRQSTIGPGSFQRWTKDEDSFAVKRPE